MSEYLCKDCKHSFRTVGRVLAFGLNSAHAYQCKKSYKEDHYEPDAVVGQKLVKAGYQSCALFRLGMDGYCGHKAEFWQPKEKKNFFKLIIKESQ